MTSARNDDYDALLFAYVPLEPADLASLAREALGVVRVDFRGVEGAGVTLRLRPDHWGDGGSLPTVIEVEGEACCPFVRALTRLLAVLWARQVSTEVMCDQEELLPACGERGFSPLGPERWGE